jgi:hypothetical protein
VSIFLRIDDRLGRAALAAPGRYSSPTMRRSWLRGTGRAVPGERLVDGGQLAADRPELLLDRAQPALDAGVGVERGEAPVDAVDEVLDALKPLRDRADPAREARCRWPRGCSAPSRHLPRPDRLLAGLERARQRTGH